MLITDMRATIAAQFWVVVDHGTTRTMFRPAGLVGSAAGFGSRAIVDARGHVNPRVAGR